MWVRCFGFALLVWIPAVLQAQQPCSAPGLDYGYFVPVQQSYSEGTKITYSCDQRYKPVVEGWWATSTCRNGKWVHEPRCIGEKSCFLPTIANAKPSESAKGWYDDGTSMTVKCKEGFEIEGYKDKADCENGDWVTLPVCKERPGACTEPPYIPNAVIIQEYQGVYPSKVSYHCREGYATDKGSQVSIICSNGEWGERPVCKPVKDPGSQVEEPSSITTTIDRCGAFPVVQDGDYIPDGQRSLKFQCAAHYELVGREMVVCYGNGKWSEVPTCRANYCSVNTEEYPDLKNEGVRYITNGDTETLDCEDKWTHRNYAVVECNNGKPTIYQCCNWFQIKSGYFRIRDTMN